MRTKQPVWKTPGQLGDINPIDHGGGFVYVDETGTYPPKLEWIEPMGKDEYDDPTSWTVHRFSIKICTYRSPAGFALTEPSPDGILSNNPYHPDLAAWFAKPESERANRPQDTTYLANVCEFADCTMDRMIQDLRSNDPMQRASAYLAIAQYHGFGNFDQYPLRIESREEIETRYKKEPRR